MQFYKQRSMTRFNSLCHTIFSPIHQIPDSTDSTLFDQEPHSKKLEQKKKKSCLCFNYNIRISDMGTVGPVPESMLSYPVCVCASNFVLLHQDPCNMYYLYMCFLLLLKTLKINKLGIQIETNEKNK